MSKLLSSQRNAHCERARAHGATILMEPTDFEYGERQYTAADHVAPEEWGGVLVESDRP